MAYSEQTGLALLSLGYSTPADFVLQKDGSGAISLSWLHQDPQPTEQTITDTLASQAYLDWVAEHGGDPVLTARRRIREALSTDTGKVLKALVQVMIDQGVIQATPAQVMNAVVAKINAGNVD